MDPSYGPEMTLSISTPAFDAVVRRDASLMPKRSDPQRAESYWFEARDRSTGANRAGDEDGGPFTEDASELFSENGNARGLILDLYGSNRSSSFSGISTGSKSSRGTMTVSGLTQEGPAIGLGLGLAGSHSHVADDKCTSFTTTTNITEASLFSKTNSKAAGDVGDVLLGLGPSHCQPVSTNSRSSISRGIDAEKRDLGMQLQLSLSNSSNVISDDDCVSYMSLGQGSGSTYSAAKIGSECDEASIAAADEGSTSGRTTVNTGGYMPSLLLGRKDCVPLPDTDEVRRSESTFAHRELSLGSAYTATKLDELSGVFNFSSAVLPSNIERATKICKFRGCSKGARGSSGLCITHGGGRRCQRQGCNKGAEGRTVYCKSHGGGKRCQSLGCTKSAEGRTEYCIAHGGGRRCIEDGCTKAARGRSGFCIRHGGGKRCQREGCTKSAEGYSGLCISHGGGRRCQAPNCNKGAQGSTMFCKAHGGGKRCMIQGCTRGAEGSTPLCKGHGGGKRCMFEGGGICTKSVHGGTSFCVAHGGGKRCSVEDCTKSARGKTFFCVRHGGGKRCKVEKCTKSAQGSTDFCKAHGGGKRCSWGQEGTPYIDSISDSTRELFTAPCDRFARGKIGLCAAHCALVHDQRVHGAKTIGNALPAGIGPGLFRGLVNNPTDKCINSVMPSKGASQESLQGNEECRKYGPERRAGSDSLKRCSNAENPRPCKYRIAFVEDRSQQTGILSQLSVGYDTGFKTAGIDLVIAQDKSWSPARSNSSVSAPTTGGMSAAYGLNGCRSNQTINKAGGLDRVNYLAAMGAAANDALGGKRRVLLPPQVLVPLSMKNGQLAQSQCTNGGRNGESTSSLLPKCESKVHGGIEERVHGGQTLYSALGKNLKG